MRRVMLLVGAVVGVVALLVGAFILSPAAGVMVAGGLLAAYCLGVDVE